MSEPAKTVIFIEGNGDPDEIHVRVPVSQFPTRLPAIGEEVTFSRDASQYRFRVEDVRWLFRVKAPSDMDADYTDVHIHIKRV